MNLTLRFNIQIMSYIFDRHVRKIITLYYDSYTYLLKMYFGIEYGDKELARV